jgi:Xaa-Pro dipeptidase
MRLTKLADQLRSAELDYMALVPSSNMVYFTDLHMHLSERPTVALFPAQADADPILIAPGFEVGKARHSTNLNWRVFAYADGQSYQDAFDAAAREMNLDGKRIGVESLSMRVLESNLLSTAAPRARLVAADDVIKPIRIIKDANEIAAMRKAIALTQDVLARTLEEVKPGMTEQQVANIMTTNALKMGAQDVAFGALIQTGMSAAFPHGGAGERVLQAGDLMVMDFGYRVDDYPADLTRTIAIAQPPSDELKRIYEIVKAANAAGRAAVKPGVRCQDVDRATRAVIEQAGYGKYFTHRTGHGLGLDVHEPPFMVEGDTTVLQPGMIFTVEPGIYIEGVGGVRIEDNMLVTENGGESLTTFTRDMIVA